MKLQSEEKIDDSISTNARKLEEQLTGKSGSKMEQRVATLPEDTKAVAVRGRMSRKQRRRAEAESGERTIADCITFGGSYGIEMTGAKDIRKAVVERRK